jgi:hypothetical protein
MFEALSSAQTQVSHVSQSSAQTQQMIQSNAQQMTNSDSQVEEIMNAIVETHIQFLSVDTLVRR